MKHLTTAIFAGTLAALPTFLVLCPTDSIAAEDLRSPCLKYDAIQPVTGLGEVCGVPDSTDFRLSQVSDLNVHFKDIDSGARPAGYVKAKACVQYFNSTGGACGSTANASAYTAPGTPSVSPSLSQWTSANLGHFKYISATWLTDQGGPWVKPTGIFAYIP